MAEIEFREEEFSLRFIKLSPGIAGRLRERLSGFEMESRRPDVISLPLRAGTDYRPLLDFIASETLDPTTYSVWASIVTSSDHGGISLPPHVLMVVRETRAGVDFSFVACTDG
jgi:hypothetical protein